MAHDYPPILRWQGDVLALNGDFLGDFPLAVMSQREGEYPRHSHAFVELVCVRKGQAVHLHGGSAYAIHPGDCFCVAPGQAHAYRDNRGLFLAKILFDPALLPGPTAPWADPAEYARLLPGGPGPAAADSPGRKGHLGPDRLKEFLGLVHALARELMDPTRRNRIKCLGILYQSVALADAACASGPGEPAEAGEGNLAVTMGAAGAWMEAHFREPVRVADIARAVHLSPSRLTHRFKSETGVSPLAYLTRLRLDAAAEELKVSGRSVSEVAKSCGFEDPGYFARVFRKALGCAPLEYRRRETPMRVLAPGV